jgi:hypothetical protein
MVLLPEGEVSALAFLSRISGGAKFDKWHL